MSEQNNSRRSKRIKAILMAVAGIAGLCGLAWAAWEAGFLESDSPSAPAVALLSPKPKSPPVAASSLPAGPAGNPAAVASPVQAKAAAAEPVQTTPSYMHSPIKTKLLTELLSELEVKKLEFAISELDQKIQNLHMPAVPAYAPLPLSQPQTGGAAVSAPVPTLAAQPKIISIEGLDGKLQAMLRTSSGRRIVKAGDRLETGRVELITDTAVRLKAQDGAIINLAFDEE